MDATESSTKSWDFPKNHIHKHTYDDILEKGSTKGFNTKYDEAMHGTIKDSYQHRGNFRDPASYALLSLGIQDKWLTYFLDFKS